MRAGYLIIVALAVISPLANLAGQGDWKSKIDPVVFQQAFAGETVEFLVVLDEQTDLGEARFLPKKEEKGTFVFEKLAETATRTQGNVLEIVWDFQAPHISFWIVNAVWTKGGMPLLEALAHLPEVREIQPNPSVKLEMPLREEGGGARTIEWGIGAINADDVWALGHTGSGVVAGGQDTGYDWDHPALKLKYRGWDDVAMTADHNYNWHDAIDSMNVNNTTPNPCGYSLMEPCDDESHGTHTMGTIAGSDGANEIGVAPDAKWMGCRNMEQGWGTPASYLECFEWFLAPTDLDGLNPNPALAPHVINNSWSCPVSEGCNTGNFATMEAAVDNLVAAGVVVVVSAGNSGSNCSTVNAPPAIFEGSFSVGATNSSQTIAGFSSRGPVTVDMSNRLKPNVSAPGVSVRSCIPGTGYGTKSGTSMAGPHVAGAVALVISANPSLSGQVAFIENILETTAVGKTTTQNCGSVLGTDIPNNTYGHGIIDALAAVNLALTTLPVALIDLAGMAEGENIRLSWQTTAEGTLNHFEIERSTNRFQWSSPGKVAFLPQLASYQFLDETPRPGVNYYRLKMVDIDGSIEYSKTIAVYLADGGPKVFFPNPVRETFSLAGLWPTGMASIRILDAGGRLVEQVRRSIEKEQAILTLDVTSLPAGVYFFQVIAEGDQAPLFQDKFIKF